MSIATERAGLFAQGLDIVTRETWGARCAYTSPRTVTRPARFLFLHVAVVRDPDDLVGTERKVMQTIEAIGQERFGIGCSYNAAAFNTGRLYEGQPLRRRGAHTVNDKQDPRFPAGSLNYTARALCLPQMDTDPVSDAQIDAAARWAGALIRAGEAVAGCRWYGHRDVAWKGCPGDAGYRRLDELNRLTRHYEAAGLVPEESDMTDEERMVLADLWVRQCYQRRAATDPQFVALEKDVAYWVAQIATRKTTFGGAAEAIAA